MDVRILAAGTALPGEPIDNAALAAQLGMGAAWEQWIDTFVGTRGRHFAFDLRTGAVRETLADLGARAARDALAKAGAEAAEIDLIVMGTSSPDQLMPTTVNVIADRLGVDGVSAYQLQSGCSGAVQALDLARHLLRGGRFGTALVIGGDTCAKHFDPGTDVAALEPGHLVNLVVFGDGAGAALLSTRSDAPGPRLLDTRVELVGLGRDPGQIVEWFGSAGRNHDRPPLVEDYQAIQDRVPVLAGEAYRGLLERLDWKDDEVDYLLPPQLSARMSERIGPFLDAPCAQRVSCVEDIGNTGNALPFFQVDRLLPRLAEGDRAVAVAIESSKWIKAAFALESS